MSASSAAAAVGMKIEGDDPSSSLTAGLMDLIDAEVAGDPPAESPPPVAKQGGLKLPAKRPAVIASAVGGDGEPSPKKVKEEFCDDGDEATSGGARGFLTPRKNKAPSDSGASPSHSEGGSPGAKKASEACCAGCGRIQGVSPDFLVVGETCAWAFNTGRGQWCRECHRVHQNIWQQSHALAFFAGWLEKSKENRLAWEETLFADLSLRWEGCNRVSPEMVTKRVSVLKWVFGVIRTDPIRSAGTEGFIREWLARLAGAPPADDGPMVKDESGVGLSLGKTRSSIGKQLDGLIPKAKQLMAAFAEDTWAITVSDGSFTKICNNLAGIYAQCGAVGESRDVVEQALLWTNGAQAAKQFLKAVRVQSIRVCLRYKCICNCCA